MGCTVGSGAVIRRRSIAAVKVEAGFRAAVPDGRGDKAAVNVASFSARVRPLRAMEKRDALRSHLVLCMTLSAARRQRHVTRS